MFSHTALCTTSIYLFVFNFVFYWSSLVLMSQRFHCKPTTSSSFGKQEIYEHVILLSSTYFPSTRTMCCVSSRHQTNIFQKIIPYCPEKKKLFLISRFSVLKKKIFLTTLAKLISGEARNSEGPKRKKKVF